MEGRTIPIDEIHIELVAKNNDALMQKKCNNFSLRGYTSEMRKKNPSLCDPFVSDGVKNKLDVTEVPRATKGVTLKVKFQKDTVLMDVDEMRTEIGSKIEPSMFELADDRHPEDKKVAVLDENEEFMQINDKNGSKLGYANKRNERIPVSSNMEGRPFQISDNFSIRGYTSEMRKKNPSLCDPFVSDGVKNKLDDQSIVLSGPLLVLESRELCCPNFHETGSPSATTAIIVKAEFQKDSAMMEVDEMRDEIGSNLKPPMFESAEDTGVKGSGGALTSATSGCNMVIERPADRAPDRETGEERSGVLVGQEDASVRRSGRTRRPPCRFCGYSN